MVTMTENFLDRLQRGPVLCDGAMGTMLHLQRRSFERPFDELCLLHPEWVVEVHRGYLEAGAEVLETNTFGANRFRLEEHDGLAGKVGEICAAGVRLAREASAHTGRPAFVAGSVGPLGTRLAPTGSVTPDDAYAAFAETCAALAAGGADLLILETFSDLEEMRLALKAARAACDLPVVAQMTFTQDRRTPVGYTPETCATALAELGADVIGVNCSVGPARVLPVVEAMAAALAGRARPVYLSAQPNAGWPEAAGGRLLYPATPAYFGEYAQRFVQAGVSLVGGCCGTTPEHIRAMRLALDAQAMAPRHGARVSVTRPSAEPRPVLPPEPPTALALRLARGEFVVSIEMSPPKGFNAGKVLAGALMLRQAGATVINIADTPRARMRMSAWAVAHLVQTQVGIESVLHFPTRGRNLLRIQGDLLAAHALNLRNLFVVMGDPPSIGDYPEATDTNDVVPSGLVALVKQKFNQGFDPVGASIGQPCSFLVGVALDLNARDVEREVKLLRKKLAAGADFALTQPVYDTAQARAFLRRYTDEFGPLKLPVLAGLLPLASERHAEFLHNEVPGIVLTDAARERIRRAGDRGRLEGIRLAQELLLEFREFAQGVYLIPPFGRYDTAAEVLEVLRPEPAGPARRALWPED
jgi:methionine synthase I (cobalamin-dependent)/5,10-methylenetetrahydrofolate reductase